jgi:hypothetical protein
VPTQWILSTGAIATGISLILFAVMPVGATYWTYFLWATVSSIVNIFWLQTLNRSVMQMLTVLGADCGK